MMKVKEPTQKELGRFGIGAVIILTLIGGFALYKESPSAPYLFGLAVVMLVLRLLSIAALRIVYRGWMLIGLILGWINVRILMALALYLVFTPVRLIQLALGRDPLARKLDPTAKSYFSERKPLSRKHFDRMF